MWLLTIVVVVDTMFLSRPIPSTAGPPYLTAEISQLLRKFASVGTGKAHALTMSQSYDNTYALHQIEEGHFEILSRTPATDGHKKGPALKGKTLPRVITLGGDHTITLPLLRSINRAYGPVSVIHFDSHLDTCKRRL